MGSNQVTGAHSVMVKNNASREDSDDVSSIIIDSKQTSGQLPHGYSSLADLSLTGLIAIEVLLLIVVTTIC